MVETRGFEPLTPCVQSRFENLPPTSASVRRPLPMRLPSTSYIPPTSTEDRHFPSIWLQFGYSLHPASDKFSEPPDYLNERVEIVLIVAEDLALESRLTLATRPQVKARTFPWCVPGARYLILGVMRRLWKMNSVLLCSIHRCA